MAETEYVLQQSFTTTINASGTGSVTVGPAVAYTRWKIARYSVQAAPNACLFVLYRGDPAQKRILDNTPAGGNDTSGSNEITLYPGEYITGVWTNATPGATAIFTIEDPSKQFVKGQRSY